MINPHSAIDLQLKNISFGFSTGQKLIFDKKTSNFHLSGSETISEEHIVDRAIVVGKINDFIIAHDKWIIKPQIRSLEEKLENRIKVVHSYLYGFIDFFRYLINPAAKKKLLEEEKALYKLTETLKKHPFPEKIEINPLAFDPSKTFSIKIDSPHQSLPNTAHSSDSPLSRGAIRRLTFDPTPVSAPRRVQLTSAVNFLSPQSGLNLSQEIHSPVPEINAQDIRFDNEPNPLNFHPKRFKNLSEEEIRAQIESIDEYLFHLGIALKPIRDILADYQEMVDCIVSDKAKLQEIQDRKQRLCDLYYELGGRKETSEPTLLKDAQGTPVIVMSDQLRQKVISRHEKIEEEKRLRKEELKTEIETLEARSNNSETQTLEALRSELQSLNGSTPFNINALKKIPGTPFTQEKIFSTIKKREKSSLSECQILLDSILKSEDTLDLIRIKCKPNNGLIFDQFKEILDKKEKLILLWNKFRQERLNYLQKSKIEQERKEKEADSTNNPLLKEFPFLALLNATSVVYDQMNDSVDSQTDTVFDQLSLVEEA